MNAGGKNRSSVHSTTFRNCRRPGIQGASEGGRACRFREGPAAGLRGLGCGHVVVIRSLPRNRGVRVMFPTRLSRPRGVPAGGAVTIDVAGGWLPRDGLGV